jgi:hypothetical protein
MGWHRGTLTKLDFSSRTAEMMRPDPPHGFGGGTMHFRWALPQWAWLVVAFNDDLVIDVYIRGRRAELFNVNFKGSPPDRCSYQVLNRAFVMRDDPFHWEA